MEIVRRSFFIRMFFLSTFFYSFVIFLNTYAESNGTLDITFGTDGRTYIHAEDSPCQIHDIALQADGKVVGVGFVDTGVGTDGAAVTRLNADGSPDTAGFGAPNGYVVISVGGTITNTFEQVAIQNDQKIVAIALISTGSNVLESFTVVRFNTDGSLDTTFNGTGIVHTDVNGDSEQNAARGLAIQTDQKIVVAGYTNISSVFKIAVTRYNTDGSLDTTFGTNGIVITDPSVSGVDGGIGTNIALQPDGKILVCGQTGQIVSTTGDVAVVRYNTDGSLDTTFGTNGIVRMSLSGNRDVATNVVVQSNNKIVVAAASNNNIWFTLFRLNSNGSLDTTYGTAGVVATTLGFSWQVLGSSVDAVLQTNDKLVVTGIGGEPSSSTNRPFRYLTNGSVDPDFNPIGPVLGLVPSRASALAIRPDEKIVIGGWTAFGAPPTDDNQWAFAQLTDANPCTAALAEVGSDTEVTLFTTQQYVAAGGRFALLALLNGGFSLCGDASFDSCFPVAGPIALECFTLTLNNDLYMHNVSDFYTIGNIIGNNYLLDLSQTVSIVPTHQCEEE